MRKDILQKKTIEVWVTSLLVMSGCTKSIEGAVPADQVSVTEKASATEKPAPEGRLVEPGPSFPLITMVPMDGKSSTGQADIEVIVFPKGHFFEPETLDSIAKTIKLETWPEGQVVPFRVDVKDETKGGQLPSGAIIQPQGILKVVPKDALEDRWYLLTAETKSALPSSPQSQLVFPDQQRVGTRFRPGSQKVMSRLSAVAKGDGKMIVAVQMSEPIAAVDAAKIRVTFTEHDKPLECAQRSVAGRMTSIIEYQCPQGTDSFSLSVQLPFESPKSVKDSEASKTAESSGNIQAMAPTQELVIDSKDLRDHGSGEFTWAAGTL